MNDATSSGESERWESQRRALCMLLPLVSTLAWLLMLTSGCAKVGDPLPPVIRIPEPVRNLKVVQTGMERTDLVFPLTDTAVREVAVYRECGVNISDQSQPLARVKVDELAAGTEPDTRVFRDSEAGRKGLCTYAVRLSGSRGRWSEFSNSVSTDQVPVAEAPTRLRAKVFEDRIELTWDPPVKNLDGTVPANLHGYLVNAKYPSSEARYSDKEFNFGVAQTYSVQSVSRKGNPMIVSPPSSPLRIEPIDTFPPKAPARLQAVAVEGAIQLIWEANSERDLAGYAVYRRAAAGSFVRISPLVTVNRFLDESVGSDTLIEYAVAAIDNVGNESGYSEVVTVDLNP